jgi:hypothetical protein
MPVATGMTVKEGFRRGDDKKAFAGMTMRGKGRKKGRRMRIPGLFQV